MEAVGAPATKVLIGDEIPIEELKNNSVVLAPYRVTENITGVLGVLGPARMDYPKIISALEFFTQQLSNVLCRDFGGAQRQKLMIGKGDE